MAYQTAPRAERDACELALTLYATGRYATRAEAKAAAIVSMARQAEKLKEVRRVRDEMGYYPAEKTVECQQ